MEKRWKDKEEESKDKKINRKGRKLEYRGKGIDNIIWKREKRRGRRVYVLHTQ